MSLVDLKVELGVFGTTSLPFVLDSLDNGILGTSQIAGLEFSDVTHLVRSVSVNRGKSRQLDYYNAGSASVVFDNRGRELDPSNQSSTFYPNIGPRNIIKVSSGDESIFSGYVTDWDLTFDVANNDSIVAACSDAFLILSNQFLTAHTTSTALSGVLIETLLNRSEIEFAGPRVIDDGLSQMVSDNVALDTNLLTYLHDVERSEQGDLFISKDGVLVFKERGTVSENNSVVFADDGSGIFYQDLINEFGDERLYNRISLSGVNGSSVQSDISSIARFQTSTLSYSDLLNNSSNDFSLLAKILLTKFKEPKVVFSGLSVQILGVSESEKAQILSLDLNDFVTVIKSFVVGSPTTISQSSKIIGIRHNISPGSHVVSFVVEDATAGFFLILGDSFAGKLDLGLLDV